MALTANVPWIKSVRDVAGSGGLYVLELAFSPEIVDVWKDGASPARNRCDFEVPIVHHYFDGKSTPEVRPTDTSAVFTHRHEGLSHSQESCPGRG